MVVIKDTPGFERDFNGAIVSIDKTAYDTYMETYNARISREKEINSKIQGLESDVSEIKQLLKELIQKVS